jgi:4-hydroxy-4-methyl-2-oxoglutarate aldolase
MIEDPPLVTLRRSQRRPSADRIAALTGVPTGHVADAMDGRGSFDAAIKACFPDQAHFCGVAITCHAGPADNLAVMAALAVLSPGDVIVAGTDGYKATAVVGDLVLGMAKNSGAVGFVTDGCVRDLVGIRQVGLPAWAMGVTPNSPHRSGPGTVGHPVLVAGWPVHSGDVIVADLDGVVVIPQRRLAEVLQRLPAIRKAEAAADEQVRRGATKPGFLG